MHSLEVIYCLDARPHPRGQGACPRRMTLPSGKRRPPLGRAGGVADCPLISRLACEDADLLRSNGLPGRGSRLVADGPAAVDANVREAIPEEA